VGEEADVEAIIPAPAPAISAVTVRRKSIIKTRICCGVMSMKMAKSAPAVKPAIAPNTNARWLLPSSEHVTWLFFPSLVKYCARISWAAGKTTRQSLNPTVAFPLTTNGV
jgi:hypothetical protein